MKTNAFLDWCKNHSKLIGSLVTAIAAIVIALLTSSCGSTTRATVRNNATGTTTEIKITTNNPTSISTKVDPTTNVDYQTKKDTTNVTPKNK